MRNIMKRACAVTILAQNAKQGTPLSHSKQVPCDKVLGQNSCQPEGLQPESALAALLVLRRFWTFAATSALPSPILAATHACFIMLRTLNLDALPLRVNG